MIFLIFALGAISSRRHIQEYIAAHPEKDSERVIFWSNLRILLPAMLGIFNISVNLYFHQNFFSTDFLSPFFQ